MTPATVPPIHRLGKKRGIPPWIWAIVVLVVLALLLMVLAPSSKAGSSFDRSPWGSRQFFTYLEQQGFQVKRWQRSYDKLQEQEGAGEILLRIGNNPFDQGQGEISDWQRQGNTVVQLSWGGRVTQGRFSQRLPTSTGPVQVDTRRRVLPNQYGSNAQVLLEDAQGAFIVARPEEKGTKLEVIYPWLVANAYDRPELANYQFMADLLVARGGRNSTIWFDEWLHGYRLRDASDLPQNVAYQDFIDYLSQTPWLGVFLQGILVFLFLLWHFNHRFGPLITPSLPEVNNSLDYIQAMAGVLHRAEQTDFVLNQLRDRLRYDVAYGLAMVADRNSGRQLPDDGELVRLWAAETGRNAQELQQLLDPKDQKQSMGPQELLAWLDKAESIVRGRR